MNKEELRALVAQMIQQQSPIVEKKEEIIEDSNNKVEDITGADLRKQYLVENAVDSGVFFALKSKTPARLGVGRTGTRYRTVTMLRFRADHALAQDSVFSDVPEQFWKEHGLPFVQTACRSKDEYLTRPDLGRRFLPEAQDTLKTVCGQNPKLVLVIGDGLSSNAIVANAMECAAAIRQGLKSLGIPEPPAVFVKYCRVGASDALGEITGCECVCMLVGERPGLVTSESMSCYITYAPRPGIPESRRTVISNIHRQGTPAVEAGAHIAALLDRILRQKASGIELRRENSQ